MKRLGMFLMAAMLVPVVAIPVALAADGDGAGQAASSDDQHRMMAGSVQSFNYGPRGVEGIMLSTNEGIVQLNLMPEVAAQVVQSVAVGDAVKVTGQMDNGQPPAPPGGPDMGDGLQGGPPQAGWRAGGRSGRGWRAGAAGGSSGVSGVDADGWEGEGVHRAGSGRKERGARGGDGEVFELRPAGNGEWGASGEGRRGACWAAGGGGTGTCARQEGDGGWR